MVIATPFPKAPKAFYYNQKINCLPATGQVTVGGDTVLFEPESAFGVFDWGRGVWTYDNTWYWGSASGVVDAARSASTSGTARWTRLRRARTWCSSVASRTNWTG